MSILSEERIQFEEALYDLFVGIDMTGIGNVSDSRLTVINYVKAKLDEITFDGTEGLSISLSASPNVSNPLDLLINAHLDESTKDVILSAPLSVLYPSSINGNGNPFYSGAKTGYIELPDNFLRLSSFKMVDWKRDVTMAITPNDPLYKKQAYSFLRGGVNKPVAVLNWKNVAVEGEADATKKVLEYYSIDSTHTIDKLFIIQEQAAETFIVNNPNLMDSLAWMCASKILQITGMGDLSKAAMEQVKLSYNNL